MPSPYRAHRRCRPSRSLAHVRRCCICPWNRNHHMMLVWRLSASACRPFGRIGVAVLPDHRLMWWELQITDEITSYCLYSRPYGISWLFAAKRFLHAPEEKFIFQQDFEQGTKLVQKWALESFHGCNARKSSVGSPIVLLAIIKHHVPSQRANRQNMLRLQFQHGSNSIFKSSSDMCSDMWDTSAIFFSEGIISSQAVF